MAPPSLGGETGGLYLILGPMELSAAERYTTSLGHPGVVSLISFMCYYAIIVPF